MIPIPSLLASDTTGAAVAVLGMILLFGLCGLVCIPINRFWGRGKWWGLTIAIIPTAGGALAEFFMLTVRGGAPPFAHVIAILPLLVGLRGIQLWSRPA